MRFRRVVALTGPFLPLVSFLARLPAAMGPIGSLLLVNAHSGIATAGLVSGALALGQAGGGPVIGRLADRRGQRRVVLAASALNGTALAALVLAVQDGRPPLAQAALALAAGLSVPQIGPLTRSRLVPLAKGDPRLTGAALSFDGTVDETSFVTGPALVGLLAVLDPAVALLVAAALVVVFGTAFALHPTAPRPVRAAAPGPRPRLVSVALALLFAGMALQGMVFGAIQTGVTELAERLGAPEAAGLVYGLMGVPSALVGLVMTALPPRLGTRAQLRLATAVQFALALALPAVAGLTSLAVTVAALGLTIAPTIIAMFALVERTAPAARLGEAMTVLGSAIILGTSGGAMLAGRLAEAAGHRAAFATAIACAGAAAALALLTATRGRYRAPAPAPGAKITV
ncbi:MFS transporter [Actinomadura kijaniata]|uniref:MFS transporter n=1 Tax=Actinomadura kijaniata TaxID=46161 RepID=UPI003F1A6DAA